MAELEESLKEKAGFLPLQQHPSERLHEHTSLEGESSVSLQLKDSNKSAPDEELSVVVPGGNGATTDSPFEHQDESQSGINYALLNLKEFVYVHVASSSYIHNNIYDLYTLKLASYYNNNNSCGLRNQQKQL